MSALLLAAVLALPQTLDAEWLRTHYAKSEHALEMRDGARLYTAVFTPRDADAGPPLPIVLVRTNFGCAPYGPDGYPGWIDPGIEFLERGVIVAFQDVRGAYLSEGEFTHLTPHQPDKLPGEVDESTDGYDTIDWLVREVPHNSGRVALMGGSYNGFFVLASMIDAHPALVCAVPQAPTTDPWHDDVFHNGAVWLTHMFGAAAEWDVLRGEPTTERPPATYPIPWSDDYAGFLETIGPLARGTELLGGKSPLWNALTEHPTRDAYWRARNILHHLERTPPAVLVVGGWYDAEDLYGPLGVYRALAPGRATRASLVMGPWQHGEWQDAPGDSFGGVSFGSDTAAAYRTDVLVPFLSRHLFEEDVPEVPGATMFDTGANAWQRLPAWPPPTVEHALYPAAHGALSPRASARPDGRDTFVSDPGDPVPYVVHAPSGLEAEFMIADQRFAEARDDVLTWRTPPLTAPLRAAGPFEAELWVTTTAADADWIVKWIDEAPAGAGDPRGGPQRLVRAEVLRGRYREDPARPRPFEPGRPTRVAFTLPDVLHTFAAGHRVVIQVQSTWFPLIDRNPQGWVDSIPRAEAADFVPATHAVLRSAAYPSRFVLHAW